MGPPKDGFSCKGVRRSEDGKSDFQDSLQAKGGTAPDLIFHRRTRGAAFLFGDAGERHAKEVKKMQGQQIWALWKIGGFPRYSELHLKLAGFLKEEILFFSFEMKMKRPQTKFSDCVELS